MEEKRIKVKTSKNKIKEERKELTKWLSKRRKDKC
jgi:hypothetical protein